MNGAHPIGDKAGAPSTGAASIASKSTATQAQRERTVALLCAGPKSAIGLRRASIMQSSTRIHALRRRDCSIVPERRDLFDADGYRHERVAIHTLVSVPAEPGGAR